MNPETNAQFQVIIEPMQAHINNGETITKVFQSKSKSIEFFAEICIQYGYEMREGIMDAEVEAGGIGHDYRITWSEMDDYETSSSLEPKSNQFNK